MKMEKMKMEKPASNENGKDENGKNLHPMEMVESVAAVS